MDEAKDIMEIIKDLLQILILVLTATGLIKEQKGKKKNKSKGISIISHPL